MNQEYQKELRRSRKSDAARRSKRRAEAKARAELRGRILSVDQASVQLSLPIAEILAGVRDAVEAVAAQAGLLVMQALVAEEVEHLAGPRYEHKQNRQASRWGSDRGYVVFAGRKVPMERPRVRGDDGRELPLERYRRFQQDGRLPRAVARHVLAGVSMRDYEGVIDQVCHGYGVRRSSVSRHWKSVSKAALERLLERSLADLDLVVLIIDGIEFHGFLLVVALGIDARGGKHVLGLWPGATENAPVSKDLLADLVRRGLATDRRYLFVLDGSKALHAAVEATFGQRAEVQRCHRHKERNVLSYLPPSYHGTVRQRLRAAWGLNDYREAKTALKKLVEYVRQLSVSASRSLEEGLDETLTLHRLGVPELLRVSLRSTNLIESCFAATRELQANVKRWRSEEMVQRWAGTMLLEAEQQFHRIKGHRDMALLLVSLRGIETAETAA